MPIPTSRERRALAAVAVLGFLFLNGAFLYGLFVQPAAMSAALRNPVALAFMGEAMILVALSAYVLQRNRVTRLGSAAFVALSLVGGLVFSIPVALLLPRAGTAGPMDAE